MQLKYFLFPVLASLLSFQAGSALECYQCAGECKNMTKHTCPDGSLCLSASVMHENVELKVKTCATSAICGMEYAIIPGVKSVKPTCCDTNLCNSAFINVMSLGAAVLLALVSLFFSQF